MHPPPGSFSSRAQIGERETTVILLRLRTASRRAFLSSGGRRPGRLASAHRSPRRLWRFLLEAALREDTPRDGRTARSSRFSRMRRSKRPPPRDTSRRGRFRPSPRARDRNEASRSPPSARCTVQRFSSARLAERGSSRSARSRYESTKAFRIASVALDSRIFASVWEYQGSTSLHRVTRTRHVIEKRLLGRSETALPRERRSEGRAMR